MISIGGIIGAGLFVGSSVAISASGPAAVLSYLLAGVLVLMVMRMLGEMAVALPTTSSFTEFARVGLGPWAGFICGWLYWYFWIIVVPVEAIAGANILHHWLPLPTWQLGLGLMAVMTAVNLMSARSYAEFEFWFASSSSRSRPLMCSAGLQRKARPSAISRATAASCPADRYRCWRPRSRCCLR
jgi:AAT family amino acid transporter/GABA permease